MTEKTGIEEYSVLRDGKRLRFGYTTGSCAAAAAKAAAYMLLSGEPLETVELLTPKGILLHLSLQDIQRETHRVRCAVQKYSGDDPDVTNGILVYAEAFPRTDSALVIDGGRGVGRVTKPGLQQKIGEAAINRVPRQMIERECRELLEQFDVPFGLNIVISIPQGVEIAKRTFNPRLGIEGGISVLGTSGIVEPMSEAALLESIALEIRQKKALGTRRLILSPGNYGADFLRTLAPIEETELVKCSNYLGDTLELAAAEGFSEILLISHIGKIIKAAGGIMNTHSRIADARAEIMAACALRAGCDGTTARRILDAVTTDEMLAILEQNGLLTATMTQAGIRIQQNLNRRTGENTRLGIIIFSNEKGILQMTGPAAEWLTELQSRKEASL